MNSVAFYLDNSKLPNTNFSQPLDGNPGTGATEYMTVLFGSQLSNQGINVTLYVTKQGNFPKNLDVKVVKGIRSAIDLASLKNQILVIRAYISEFITILNYISEIAELKIIIWAHLTPSQIDLKVISRIEQIKAIVCLENNQRVRMGDSLCASKLFTIPYCITGDTKSVDLTQDNNNVAYMGALVPQKGFHLLADAWPKVLEVFPDSQLFVLGSGNLYNSEIQLGEEKVATKEFEKRIFKKLSKFEPSVKFLGNSNSKVRSEILDNCKLGIVNPSGQTETFCLSAVEFQQKGVPVIGARKFGLLDTVQHRRTGTLILNPSRLAYHIIRHLSDSNWNKKLGSNAQKFVLKEYELESVIQRWVNLIYFISLPGEVSIHPKTRKMKIRSIQAIFCKLNYFIVRATNGKWPTILEIFEFCKKFSRKVTAQIRILTRYR